MTRKTHVIYLAIIIVLLIFVTMLGAKVWYATQAVAAIERQFGINFQSMPLRLMPLHKKTPDQIQKIKTMKDYRSHINLALDNAISSDFKYNTEIQGATKLALSGGKRLRPIIMMEIARKACKEPVDTTEAATAIEYIHAASLVVDDMPHFDNDILRRGEPTVHKQFGSDVAQMTAMALMAAATHNLCRQVDWIKTNCNDIKHADQIGMQLCSIISRSLSGAAAGQLLDMRHETVPAQSEAVLYLKTATFFEISVVAGWVLAGQDLAKVAQIQNIGRYLGVAFQIADDIGDMKKDAAKGTYNFANINGASFARAEMEQHLISARNLLTKMDLWSEIWEVEIYPAIYKMSQSED